MPGATTASTILTGLDDPDALAFDSSGNLFVGEQAGFGVEEFSAGRTTPVGLDLTFVSDVIGLAFDPAATCTRTIRRAGFTSSNVVALSRLIPLAAKIPTVWSSTPAATSTCPMARPLAIPLPSTPRPVRLTRSLPGSLPGSLALDSHGNLYAINKGDNTLDVFDSITTAPGDVTIRSSVASRPMLIGGTNSMPVQGINLTSAEMAQIATATGGTVTIGDTAQTGNITFSTATPVTTAGAALNVVQSLTGTARSFLMMRREQAQGSMATAER